MNSRMLIATYVKYTRVHRFRNTYFPPFISFSELIGDSPFLLPFYTGSVSVGVWQIACRRLIVVGEKAVKSFIGKLILCRTPSSSSVANNFLAPSQLDPKTDNMSISSLAPTPNNTPRKSEKNDVGGTS
jgi:hypothetical protein